MTDEIKLSRNEMLMPVTEHEHSSSSRLFEDAWQSFKNQPTSHIVAEVALGTAALVLAARSILAHGAKDALRATPGAVLDTESSSAVGRGIFGKAETGVGKGLSLGSHYDGGIFPANSRDLRAALESFPTAGRSIPVPPSAEVRLAQNPATQLKLSPRTSFSEIEDAMQRIRKTGFPKLEH